MEFKKGTNVRLPRSRAQYDLFGSCFGGLVREIHARLARPENHNAPPRQLGAGFVFNGVVRGGRRPRRVVLRVENMFKPWDDGNRGNDVQTRAQCDVCRVNRVKSYTYWFGRQKWVNIRGLLDSHSPDGVFLT